MRRREKFLRQFHKARQYRSVPLQMWDILIHKLRINTHWEDYYKFEFFKGELSWEERSLYLGMKGSRYWPHEGNSLKFDRIFLLKSLQKAVLAGNGLPTPKLLLKAGRLYRINTREKFREAVAGIDRPVMSKFDGGGSGVGILALQPEPGGFRCGDRIVDADWVWDQYAEGLDRGFLLEERVSNHPVLDEIYPAGLNTMRLTAIRTADDRWHLVRPFLKFGRQGAHVDNLGAGGIFAGIDSSGRLGMAYDGNTKESFEHHPDTGARIAGVPVPHFEEARALALDASQVFGFMATMAWDVGLTPEGPTLIEANPAWELKRVQDILGPYLTPEVARGLMPRSWWTPWDHTHMYPDYMKDAHGGPWQRMLARRRRSWRARLRRRLGADT